MYSGSKKVKFKKGRQLLFPAPKKIAMQKFILFFVFICGFISSVNAQGKFFTKTGKITFDGKATFDKIHAENKTVAAVLDTKTGALSFSVLIKGFEFKKALMQTHFNEKYMESDKFPKSDFKGTITNNASIVYTDGVYDAAVKGKLTIHGETKDVEAKGKITVKGGKISLNAAFTINIPDYKISAQMKDQVTITVDCSNLEPLK
jgi:polyisoprenoid-binding protein YceI